METSDVFTEGSNIEMTKPEEQKLSARGVSRIEDDLDFDTIREMAKKAQKEKVAAAKPITQEELRAIPTYINDMSRYIRKYAAAGKIIFQYDCGKLSTACFLELAQQFKQKYPRFFVVTQMGTQIITIDWSGKNEV